MTFKFSVVIPTTGHLNNLKKLLNSLSKVQEIEKSEIILILNPPSSALEGLQNQYLNLNLTITSSATGVNYARNQGLKVATGEFIFFLDDDCWVSDPQLLIKQEKFHLENPWAFAIGGFYHSTNLSALSQAYGQIQTQWLLNNRISKNGECLTLLGGYFSLRNKPDLPRFDESILYGGAETEYFFRLGKKGYRYLLTDLSVNHEPKLTLFSFIRKAHLQGKTHQRLLQTGAFQPSLWQFPSPSAHLNILYLVVFNRNWRFFYLRPIQKIRGFLKSLHHDFWFYLSNRNRF